MDRFNSREDDLSFLSTEYAEGMLARGQGKMMEDNPYCYLVGYKERRWNAGWADQDMIQLQEVRK